MKMTRLEKEVKVGRVICWVYGILFVLGTISDFTLGKSYPREYEIPNYDIELLIIGVALVLAVWGIGR